ncbi:hypothetical protein Hfont_2951 [Herminiimonas fonticola]|nr:hypothetical protein Hfont_2951 [Herminiimonas fonticola]
MRSNSSRLEYRTSRYSSAVRTWLKATCVCVVKLVTGVRNSCAMSAEKLASFPKPSSIRPSMSLNDTANSSNSIGTSVGLSRTSSWEDRMARISLETLRIGRCPHWTANHATTKAMSATIKVAHHRMRLNMSKKSRWKSISIATATR